MACHVLFSSSKQVEDLDKTSGLVQAFDLLGNNNHYY